MPDKLIVALKKAVARGLEPEVEAAGFCRTDAPSLHPSTNDQFHRPTPSGLMLVNVQRDRAKDWVRRGGMFTMNVGLYLPQVERGQKRALVGGVPGSDWTVSVRVGLRTQGADHWWRLGPSPDIDASAGELRSAWRSHIKPWFDRHADPSAAIERMAGHGQAFAAAILSRTIGDPDRSRSLLAAHFARRSNPDDPAVVWAGEAGIPTDQAAAKLRWAVIQDTPTLTAALHELFGPADEAGHNGRNANLSQRPS